jgi:hypothetical protein
MIIARIEMIFETSGFVCLVDNKPWPIQKAADRHERQVKSAIFRKDIVTKCGGGVIVVLDDDVIVVWEEKMHVWHHLPRHQ